MSRRIYISFAVLVIVVFTLPFMASADCDGSPTNGDDAFTCSGNTNNDVNGRRGDDFIINDDLGIIDGNLSGDGTTALGVETGGDDTLVNNGTVTGAISGDAIGALGGAFGGHDNIMTTGISGSVYGDGAAALGLSYGGNDTIMIGLDATVNGDVFGDYAGGVGAGIGGNDLIIIQGTVNGGVSGDGVLGVGAFAGNDVVVLMDGANVTGVIDGDDALGFFTPEKHNHDVLVFNLTISDEDKYNQLAGMIAAQLPSGSFSYRGVTYTWQNFEELVNALIKAFSSAAIHDSRVPDPECLLDGRLNNCDLGAPLAVYCSAEGVRVVDLNGDGTAGPEFSVTDADIDAALTQAVNGGSNVLIAEANGNSLYALTSGELQVMGPEILEPGKTYTYLFPGDTCG